MNTWQPCSVCGYSQAVRKDGTIRKHSRLIQIPPYESVPCEGSSKPPRELAPTSVNDDYWIYTHGPVRDSTNYSGKWMLFIPAEQIDATWDRIKDATETGVLGTDGKVSTNLPNPNAQGSKSKLICVYTRDCRDMEDVRRVLKSLRELGFHGRINYKEDSASLAQIYGSGASLYTSPYGLEIKKLRDTIEPSPHLTRQDNREQETQATASPPQRQYPPDSSHGNRPAKRGRT